MPNDDEIREQQEPSAMEEVVDEVNKESTGGFWQKAVGIMRDTATQATAAVSSVYKKTTAAMDSSYEEDGNSYMTRTLEYRAEKLDELKKMKESDTEAFKFYKKIKEEFSERKAFFGNSKYTVWFDLAQELIKKDSSRLTSAFITVVNKINSKAGKLKKRLAVVKKQIKKVAESRESYEEKQRIVDEYLHQAESLINAFLADAVEKMSGYILHLGKYRQNLKDKVLKVEPLSSFKIVKIYFCLKTAGCDRVVLIKTGRDVDAKYKGRGVFEKWLSKEYAELVEDATDLLERNRSRSVGAAAAAAAGDVE